MRVVALGQTIPTTMPTMVRILQQTQNFSGLVKQDSSMLDDDSTPSDRLDTDYAGSSSRLAGLSKRNVSYFPTRSRRISQRLNRKLAKQFRNLGRPQEVVLKKYYYFRQLDSFTLGPDRYVVSKSHGQPFGCLGNICDYELGAIDTAGIAGTDDSVFRVCRERPGRNGFGCWKNADAVATIGRRLVRSSLPPKHKAALFARTVHHYNPNLLSDRSIVREGKRELQRARFTKSVDTTRLRKNDVVVGGLGGIGSSGKPLGNDYGSIYNVGDGKVAYNVPNDAGVDQWYETDFINLPKGDWE